MAEKIPVYNAPIQKPNVPVTGLEMMNRAAARLGYAGEEEGRLTEQAGRSIASGLREVGAGIGSIGKEAEQHDINADLIGMHTASASMLNGLSTQFNQFMAQNGGNANANQEFFEKFVQPAVEQLQDNAQTEKGRVAASELGANMANHFTQMGAHFQAQAAANAAAKGLQTTNTNLTQAVDQNPGNLPMALKSQQLLHDSLSEANPNAPAETVKASLGQARQDLILHAGDSYIRQSLASGQQPDVMQFLGKYGGELSPEARTTLQQHEVSAVALGKAQGEVTAAQTASDQREATSNATANTIFSAFDANNNRVAIPSNFFQKLVAVSQTPGSDEANKSLIKSAVTWARSNPTPPTTDPATMRQLVASLASGNRPTTNDLMKQVMAGKLSFQDAQWMNNALKGPPSPGLVQLDHNLSQARERLADNAGSGSFSPAGMAAYNRFQDYAVTHFLHEDNIEPSQLDGVLETFKPNGQDAAQHALIGQPEDQQRRSLGEIFGGQ